MGAQGAKLEIVGERSRGKTQRSAVVRVPPTSRTLDGWLLLDSVVRRAALVLRPRANGPERGACGGVSVPDDVVPRRAA